MRISEEHSSRVPGAIRAGAGVDLRCERIRRDHGELRRRLDEIELLMAHWEAGSDVAGAALRERGCELYDRLGSHIEWEERILSPLLLASVDGGERAMQLAADHRDQREVLAFLRARMRGSRPPVLLVRELRTFLAIVREDMAREEVWLQELEDAG